MLPTRVASVDGVFWINAKVVDWFPRRGGEIIHLPMGAPARKRDIKVRRKSFREMLRVSGIIQPQASTFPQFEAIISRLGGLTTSLVPLKPT